MVNRRRQVGRRQAAIARAAALIVGGVVMLGVPSAAVAGGHDARATVEALRVDTFENPIGVGHATPNLSWRLAGGHQSAYQIQVASSPSRLDRPDLWDSGKVRSDDTGNVGYAGAPLHSREAVIWRVRVWDDRMV